MAIAAGGDHSLALKNDGSIIAWGQNAYSQTIVPNSLTNVVAVAPGWDHTVVAKTDGTVVAWGPNSYGETNVPAGLANVKAVAAGDRHSMALQSNGTVVCWGDTTYGATAVPPGLNNVVAIAAGGFHSLALTSNATVVAWGYNTYGQTNVPAGLSGVAAISAGYYHSAALKSNGTVVVWGYNVDGQTNVTVGAQRCCGYRRRTIPHRSFKEQWYSNFMGVYQRRGNKRSDWTQQCCFNRSWRLLRSRREKRQIDRWLGRQSLCRVRNALSLRTEWTFGHGVGLGRISDWGHCCRPDHQELQHWRKFRRKQFPNDSTERIFQPHLPDSNLEQFVRLDRVRLFV